MSLARVSPQSSKAPSVVRPLVTNDILPSLEVSGFGQDLVVNISESNCVNYFSATTSRATTGHWHTTTYDIALRTFHQPAALRLTNNFSSTVEQLELTGKAHPDSRIYSYNFNLNMPFFCVISIHQAILARQWIFFLITWHLL